MVKTLEEINQEFYIQWYLAGRQQPQVPLWVEPPAVQTLQQDEVERWMRELINSPDLDGAADLLDDLSLPAFDTPEPPVAAQPALEALQITSERRRGSLWASISNIVFYAALIAIVMGAVLIGGKNNGSTRFFGFQYFEVMSGSMQSVIPQGSLVITKQIPSGQIRAGDDITFLRSDEENVTHRVIEVVPDYNGAGTTGFRTQGTDNPGPDPDIVDARNVVGVVQAHVPGLGFTLRYISENLKYVFLGFVLIILLSIAVRVLLGESKKSRVHQSVEGCGQISNHRRKDQQLCKRQTAAA